MFRRKEAPLLRAAAISAAWALGIAFRDGLAPPLIGMPSRLALVSPCLTSIRTT